MKKTPIYIYPADCSILAKQRYEREEGLNTKAKTFSLTVTPHMVEECDVSPVQQFINSLQYFPEDISEMVFGIYIDFEEIEGSGIFITGEQFGSDHRNAEWFIQLGDRVPWSLFFLNDMNDRAYTIMGDMILKGKVKLEGDKGKEYFILRHHDNDVYYERMATACSMFYIYCLGTGFDAQPAIEAFLAETNVDITFEDILSIAQKELKKKKGFFNDNYSWYGIDLKKENQVKPAPPEMKSLTTKEVRALDRKREKILSKPLTKLKRTISLTEYSLDRGKSWGYVQGYISIKGATPVFDINEKRPKLPDVRNILMRTGTLKLPAEGVMLNDFCLHSADDLKQVMANPELLKLMEEKINWMGVYEVDDLNWSDWSFGKNE